jgi:hypothetical protein
MVMDMTPDKTIEQVLDAVDNASTLDGDAMTKKGAVKYDQEKVKLSLIPTKPLLELGRLMTFGANKYSAHNWREGMTFSRAMDAMERHYLAFKDGENYDKESTQHHLAAVMFYCCVILEFWFTGRVDLDDRYKPTPNEREPYDGDKHA